MKVDNLSYITLLHEFCMTHQLDKPVYRLIEIDTSNVTVRLNVGVIQREATATAELKACQTISKEMYKFLWRSTGCKGNFGENAAGQQCLNKDPGYVMEIQSGQPVDTIIPMRWEMYLMDANDYNLALMFQFDYYKRLRAYEALLSTPVLELQVTRAIAAMDREIEWTILPTRTGPEPRTVALAQIPDTLPALTFIGEDKENVIKQMIKYLKANLLLHQPEITE